MCMHFAPLQGCQTEEQSIGRPATMCDMSGNIASNMFDLELQVSLR